MEEWWRLKYLKIFGYVSKKKKIGYDYNLSIISLKKSIDIKEFSLIIFYC